MFISIYKNLIFKVVYSSYRRILIGTPVKKKKKKERLKVVRKLNNYKWLMKNNWHRVLINRYLTFFEVKLKI